MKPKKGCMQLFHALLIPTVLLSRQCCIVSSRRSGNIFTCQRPSYTEDPTGGPALETPLQCGFTKDEALSTLNAIKEKHGLSLGRAPGSELYQVLPAPNKSKVCFLDFKSQGGRSLVARCNFKDASDEISRKNVPIWKHTMLETIATGSLVPTQHPIQPACRKLHHLPGRKAVLQSLQSPLECILELRVIKKQ